jgi:hypothetical protein
MTDKVKKRIAPTLVSEALIPTNKAFEAAQKKKNPIENAADLIAMRYGVSAEAPQIDEDIFQKNRNIGKKVVPLKEYFQQTANEFVQKEAEKKDVAVQKKKENAKLTPCVRKMNTLQRNIDGYINGCDRDFSNESFIAMVDKARSKASAKPKAPRTRAPRATKATKATKATRESRGSRASKASKGGRRTRRKFRK